MLFVGRNYLYLMKAYPESGGSYAFVREQFGHDQGFLASWFLTLTYMAVFWANATSLPLFARYFFGDVLRFGSLYLCRVLYLGSTGTTILACVLLALVVTSLLGNLTALSRLCHALSKDLILPRVMGNVNQRGVPTNAILLLAGCSLLVPFVGRTAIGWIVDVTTFGATVTYGFVSAAAIKLAKSRGDRSELLCGRVAFAVMLLFGLYLLVPTLFFSGTVAAESYFLFTVWSVLGMLYFRLVLKNDGRRNFGKSIVVWIALLGLILFTSLDLMNNATLASANQTIESVRTYYREDNDTQDTEKEEQLPTTTHSCVAV